jgi:hypothetical protein
VAHRRHHCVLGFAYLSVDANPLERSAASLRVETEFLEIEFLPWLHCIEPKQALRRPSR